MLVTLDISLHILFVRFTLLAVFSRVCGPLCLGLVGVRVFHVLVGACGVRGRGGEGGRVVGRSQIRLVSRHSEIRLSREARLVPTPCALTPYLSLLHLPVSST